MIHMEYQVLYSCLELKKIENVACCEYLVTCLSGYCLNFCICTTNFELQGPSIMEEQDLEQIGVLEHSHRKKILEAAELLPRITPIGNKYPRITPLGNKYHRITPFQVTHTLKSLH